jgi:hypothetical protein
MILSQVSKQWSWFWSLEWIKCFGCVFKVVAFALAINVMFKILGCHWRRCLRGIYSLQPLLSRWRVCWWCAHRTVRWCTGHVLYTVRCVPRWCTGQVLYTVRCVPRQHVRWGLVRMTVGTLCPIAVPDSPVPHRSDFSALTCAAHYSQLFTLGRRSLA